jgi:hypothetical protein
MIECKDCAYHFRPKVTQADGTEMPLPIGQCRFFPPHMTVIPVAAVFGNIRRSPIEPGIPGWAVECNTGSQYPPVFDDWGCAQGRRKLEVAK